MCLRLWLHVGFVLVTTVFSVLSDSTDSEMGGHPGSEVSTQFAHKTGSEVSTQFEHKNRKERMKALKKQVDQFYDTLNLDFETGEI